MVGRFSTPVAAAAILGFWAAAAQAQQETVLDHGDATVSIGAGYSFLRADELVFENGNRISHLIWHSETPTVTAEGRVDFDYGWSVRANAKIAAFGGSRMADYDWLQPYLVGYDFDDWTDRSTHSDVLLHHYFSGDVALGKDIALGATTINLYAGVKYTDVSWRANDGGYVYSWTGYRENTRAEGTGSPSISFQQKLPGVFAGVDLITTTGRWTLDGQFRGGVTLGATDNDHHWRRDLRFDDLYTTQPFITARARASYQVSAATSLFVGADYDHYFETRGISHMSAISTGEPLSEFPDGVGMALRTLTVSAGLKIAF